ncbi:MAG: ABC transporter permease [Anaerolineaceae bacterium]|nr:ABC transporter permease [Anaerolineaceae bacterium]
MQPEVAGRKAPLELRLAGLPAFLIDRISLAFALGLIWTLLFIPWFVVPQRFAVFGMDLLYRRSWIGGSNLPQRGLASLDRIIGQMKGGELMWVLLAALIAAAFAALAVLKPQWSRSLSFGTAGGGFIGLAYYATFAPDLLWYGAAVLLFISSVMILMNVERGEIEGVSDRIRRVLHLPILNLLVYLLSLPIIWRSTERYEVRQARIWTSAAILLSMLLIPLHFALAEIAIPTNVTTYGVGYFVGLFISIILIGQVAVSRVVVEEAADVGEPLLKKALRRIRRDRLTVLSLAVMLLILLISLHTAFMTERLMGVTYFTSDPERTFQPIPFACGTNAIIDENGRVAEEPCRESHPDWQKHILGTDDLGRDHLARLLYAGQISLSIGISAAFLSFTIGIALGVVTGFYAGLIDDAVNWVIVTLNAIPGLYLLLIIQGLLNTGPITFIAVLGLISWTGTTRLVRGGTLSLREQEYVLSARASGASDVRIMFLHIVPNYLSVIIITLMFAIGGFILVEAALSFLNFGIPPETPTWGNMLTNARTFFRNKFDLLLFPGLMIIITVLCLYLIGDGLRDAFDPTSRD